MTEYGAALAGPTGGRRHPPLGCLCTHHTGAEARPDTADRLRGEAMIGDGSTTPMLKRADIGIAKGFVGPRSPRRLQTSDGDDRLDRSWRL
jgi:hypothetical protein